MQNQARAWSEYGAIDETERTTVDHLLITASRQRRRFGWADLNATAAMATGKPSVARARLYIAMLADAHDDDALESACIDAVVALSLWPELLVEMLINLPFTPAVTRVIFGIIGKTVPDHPVAALGKCSGLRIIKAYDAVDDGEHIRIDLAPSDEMGQPLGGYLLSIEEPQAHFAECEIVDRTNDAIYLAAQRSGPLFTEGRHVLPPSVLVLFEG